MKLKTPSKIIIILLIVGGGIFLYKHFRKEGVIGAPTSSGNIIKTNGDADLVIAYNTFPGMEGILYMNGGMEPNEQSILYKKYNLKLEIKQMDIAKDTRDGLLQGVLDAVYCTTDALPIEMSSGSGLSDGKVKEYLKINESRGADAIVAISSIHSVQDLKGKKIAYAIGTASNTLLINTLDAAGLSIKDVQTDGVSDGTEAASFFKNGQVDAAVVWAPDDEDCVSAIKGASVLISTKTATQIIADGLLIQEDNYNKKKDKFVALAKAWMEGNALLNTDNNARKNANALFAKGFSFPEDVAEKSAGKVRFSTIQDNKSFFGLDATYTGVTGEKMYSRMAVKYTEQNLAKSPSAWRNVSSDDLVQELLKDNVLANDSKQGSEGTVVFAAPTKADEKVQSKGSKVVTLNFPTAGSDLDDQDRAIIDREVAQIAQAFAGARVRVEGNTDNTGNSSTNKSLSLKRAQSVVNYLVNEHQFNRNKFIVVGNGDSKPVADNTTDDGRAANRRTDFQFIW
jgi:NitT/TauT family transport system substrate-binding protein